MGFSDLSTCMGEGIDIKMGSKEHPLGEVHESAAPILLSLGITFTLGGLLLLPLAALGLPLLIFSLQKWVREDVGLWKYRKETDAHEWGDARWAMVWIIITEVIIFASFFAFWFWARWHTIHWEGAVGGLWPAAGVEHNLQLVTVNTLILVSSGVFAHKALDNLVTGKVTSARNMFIATVILGLTFLIIQLYEYSQAGFLWGDHAYGTAFFSLTGLHGLHVLVGLICFMVSLVPLNKGYYSPTHNDSLHAIVYYWHFVDVIWILLYLIVYLEVI